MIYIYTSENCPKCDALKRQLKERGNNMYIERPADRLKNPQDEIDQMALVESAMGNMELPVMVEWEEEVK